MLEKCAPGSSIRLANHYRMVYFNGKTFRQLPKFQDIELGWVRKMVRHLGIDSDCAKSHGVI
jgi:hypothetical protein